ncbi:MAG: hypothetical protein KIT68_03145 [Phycisphaeraceae bacterium]|nr:hypothetical protein [Phycisphaeraceae bacterium]
MKLPSVSLLPALRRMVAKSCWSEAQDELFEEIFEAWSGAFGLESPRNASLSEAQQVFAAAMRVIDAGQDGNVIEGLLIKRPHLIGPGLAAAQRLGLGKIAKMLAKLQPLLPPPGHAASPAKRTAWYNSRGGARAAESADRMFMPFLRETEGAWRVLLKWTLAHPAEFFAGEAGAGRRQAPTPKPKWKPLPGSVREAIAGATKSGRVLPTRGPADVQLTEALIALDVALCDDEPDRRVPLLRREAAALLSIANAITSDGLYVGVLVNQPGAIGVARAAAKKLRLKTVSRSLDEISRLVKLDPDDLEDRLSKVERAINRCGFSREAYLGVVRIMLKHPKHFFGV